MAVDANKIDLSQVAYELPKYEGMWIAISEDNRIVSSGATYAEVLKHLVNPDRVILFKVLPLECALVC